MLYQGIFLAPSTYKGAGHINAIVLNISTGTRQQLNVACLGLLKFSIADSAACIISS